MQVFGSTCGSYVVQLGPKLDTKLALNHHHHLPPTTHQELFKGFQAQQEAKIWYVGFSQSKQLGPKVLTPPYKFFLDPKFCWTKIFFGHKFFRFKIFGPKKNLVRKKFWSEKNFCPKKFWPKKNFGPKKILVQKKFWSKKNWSKKRF